MPSHALTLMKDDEGWDISECQCGWVSPPSPDVEIAAEFYAEHRLIADNDPRAQS